MSIRYHKIGLLLTFQPPILPPLTHPVSATVAFFPFHDYAKPLSMSGPELFLFFCLEQPFFPQLFTRWLIPSLRCQLTCQLLTRKLAYQAVKSSPFLTPDNYTSPRLLPIIFICSWACYLSLPLEPCTTRIKNLPGAVHQCIPKAVACPTLIAQLIFAKLANEWFNISK